MAMSAAVDLAPAQLDTVRALLARHLPDTGAWVYGSRVRWTSRPQSDLDMVVFATPGQKRAVSDLREAFEESDLPFRVDLFVWDDVPASFRKQIEGEHLKLVNAKHASGKLKTAALGEVTKLILSSVDKKIKDGEIDVLPCNYMDVYSRRFIRSDIPFMMATATKREIKRCKLQVEDVIITKDSEKHDDIGVPALIREDVKGLVCGYHLAILRPSKDELHGPYLYYALQTEEVRHQFHSFANGVTRFGLRKDDILRVEIPLPPLPEQRAIAHFLGTLDDKIDLNWRMNETLEAMARAIFKDWFVDFGPVRAKMEGSNPYLPPEIWGLFPNRFVNSKLGEIPEGWEVGSLDDLISVNPFRRLPKGQMAPYLDMANMPTKGHIPDTVSVRPFGSGTKFMNGDTLMARITPCLENGKTAYVDFLQEGEVGWGSTEYIVLRPKSPFPYEFAYCLARNLRFREFAIQNMTGTSGRQRVQAQALQKFPLTRPTEQVAVAFGNLVRLPIARASAAYRQSHSLASILHGLLPKLMAGHIRIRDTERLVGQIT